MEPLAVIVSTMGMVLTGVEEAPEAMPLAVAAFAVAAVEEGMLGGEAVVLMLLDAR